MRKVMVAYNNVYRIVMKYKRRNSTSLVFLYDNVNNLTIKLRKYYNYSINGYEFLLFKISRNSLFIQFYYCNIK